MPSSAYDSIFAQAIAGTIIPLAYLRSLAKQESNLRPDVVGPGKEQGLLQIHPVTLQAYNLTHNKNISPDQSADPLVNATIAVWLLQRISSSFERNHPNSLRPDWQSRRWVGLVTQAYNAGESEVNGVGRVVGRLEAQGLAPERITHEAVAQANQITRDNPWLSNVERVQYINRVLAGYFAEAPGVANRPFANGGFSDLSVSGLPYFTIPRGISGRTAMATFEQIAFRLAAWWGRVCQWTLTHIN